MLLYDPRTNIFKELDVSEIAGMAGVGASAVYTASRCRRKLKSIGCYVFMEKPSRSELNKLYEAEVFEGECWRVYNSLYEVSNFGRIRRCYKSKKTLQRPFYRRKHLWVKVVEDGISKTMRLRDLVASVFLQQPKENMCLSYKNGNREDCSANNLKWIDKHVLACKTGGKSRSRSVVHVDRTSGEIIAYYASARKAAEVLYISKQTVCDYCNGKVKKMVIDLYWEDEYEARCNTGDAM